MPNAAGAAVSTVKPWRPRATIAEGLCNGQCGIAKQEKPQKGREDTDASVPCPWCHTVPALGTIPSRSCWTKRPFPSLGSSQDSF